MTTRKFGRTALIAVLALSIVMSITGGTIAWFTDEVTSANNVIKAGTLDVKLYVADKLTTNGTEDTTAWNDVENSQTGPVFSHDLWEPGYTAVKYFKVVNNGNLAFKYQLKLTPNVAIDTTTTNLAEVIDVYYKVVDDQFTAPVKAADLKSWETPGTLENMLDVDENAVHGVMLGNQEPMVIAVAMHMQETANNDYQGLSVGENFTVTLRATQYTKETDGFGTADYDKDASFVVLPNAQVEPLENNLLIITFEERGSDYSGFSWTDVPASMIRDDKSLVMDCGLSFSAKEEVADLVGKPYENWCVDFEVATNKEIKADEYPADKDAPLVLLGNYGSFKWVPVPIKGMDVEANKFYPLIGSVATLQWTYKDIIDLVGTFKCGVKADPNWATPGTTITVNLVVYEYDENNQPTGNQYTVYSMTKEY